VQCSCLHFLYTPFSYRNVQRVRAVHIKKCLLTLLIKLCKKKLRYQKKLFTLLIPKCLAGDFHQRTSKLQISQNIPNEIQSIQLKNCINLQFSTPPTLGRDSKVNKQNKTSLLSFSLSLLPIVLNIRVFVNSRFLITTAAPKFHERYPYSDIKSEAY